MFCLRFYLAEVNSEERSTLEIEAVGSRNSESVKYGDCRQLKMAPVGQIHIQGACCGEGIHNCS